MDKVLVIIVTYNAHKWLRQCLDSVDTNRYDVLVVDNASTDDTLQILCEYPRTMVHKMEIKPCKTSMKIGASPSWNNTSRRTKIWITIFSNSTPAIFEKWSVRKS